MFRLWVDADALPNLIKDVILKAAIKRSIPTTFVANKWIRVPTDPVIGFVQVDYGDDVADAYIVKNSQPNDVAISADIPLAALLVEKSVVVIDPRGDLITEANVRERLSVRDFMHGMREARIVSGGPSAFGQKDVQKFANTFDRILTKKIQAIGNK